MDIVSVGPVEEGPDALRKELAAVSSRLPGRKLGIAYLPIDVDHQAYLSAAHEGLGDMVVGATTAGAAFTERGETRKGVVVAVIGGQGFDYTVAMAKDLSRDPQASIRAAASKVVDGARRRMLKSQSLLTFADAFACEGEILVQNLQRATPPHWHHFGCTAGDDWQFKRTCVFAGHEVESDAAVLVGLYSDDPPSVGVHHGWHPVEDGKEFTITEIDGEVLKRLDDRPAAEVYREELQRLGVWKEGEDFMAAIARHELGAKTRHSELKIRAPLAINDDGSVVLASGLAHGTIVRVMGATPDRLIESAGELSRRVLEGKGSHPLHGGLVFDCGARLQLLDDRYGEEVAAFSGGRNFPLVGAAGYGEFARYGGSVEGFHNATAVMVAW